MEARVNREGLAERIGELFGCEMPDLRTYSPLTLAFVGDGIYDLVIRTAVVSRANAVVDRLHKKKSQVVKASAQAAQAEALLAELTPEELAALIEASKNGQMAPAMTEKEENGYEEN